MDVVRNKEKQRRISFKIEEEKKVGDRKLIDYDQLIKNVIRNCSLDAVKIDCRLSFIFQGQKSKNPKPGQTIRPFPHPKPSKNNVRPEQPNQKVLRYLNNHPRNV